MPSKGAKHPTQPEVRRREAILEEMRSLNRATIEATQSAIAEFRTELTQHARETSSSR